MDPQTPQADSRPSARTKKKLLILTVVAVVVGVAYTQCGDALSRHNLARQETQLRDFQQAQPAVVHGAAFLIDVLMAGLSRPGAAVLTLVLGWYFELTLTRCPLNRGGRPFTQNTR